MWPKVEYKLEKNFYWAHKSPRLCISNNKTSCQYYDTFLWTPCILYKRNIYKINKIYYRISSKNKTYFRLPISPRSNPTKSTKHWVAKARPHHYLRPRRPQAAWAVWAASPRVTAVASWPAGAPPQPPPPSPPRRACSCPWPSTTPCQSRTSILPIWYPTRICGNRRITWFWRASIEVSVISKIKL